MAVLTSPPTNLMGPALDAEIARLERVIAHAGALLCLGGVPLSIYIALAISRPLGMVILGFAIGLLGWFVLVRTCLDRGVGIGIFPWLNPLVEISLPTLLMIIDLSTEGPVYAISQPVPLELYGIFIAVSVLRLRPWVPALVGLMAAFQYLTLYHVSILPQLPAELLSQTAMRPDMIHIRGVILALGGVAASLVSRAIRGAVNSAAVEVRSQELFGKYRLGKELASGGMGVVFRAVYCPEGGFQRPVALKRIHPHLARQSEFVERFREEAELCSHLLHPNIVQVLDFGRVGDTYFFAMEFVDGVTALELMQRCRKNGRVIPANLVAWIGRELCSGLAFAHEGARDAQGQKLRVIHRDINLPNILVSRSGEVKILDFGIARVLGEVRQSITAQAVGKLAYIAPEQINGGHVDTRSDLFSAGVVLWEMLCMQPLFNRNSDGATLGAVLHGAVPPPSTLRTELKTPLWDAFMAEALQRDPSHRFQRASEMVEMLDNILELEGLPRPGEFQLFLETLPEQK